jgi:Sec7-like guanine-nucleotide exchange factor
MGFIVQVKRKMTEEEFIPDDRTITHGKDLPREMLTHLYHSIAKNGERLLQAIQAAMVFCATHQAF